MASGPHHGSLQKVRLKEGIAVSEKAHPETVLIFCLDIGRSHVDLALAWVVVGVNQFMDDIHPAHGAAVQKYIHILVLIVRLNRLTAATFWSLTLEKWWIPWRSIRAWKSELKNSLPLSVCSRWWWRGFAAVSTCPKAAVIALASYEWTGIAQANLENTSITVRRYFIPPFCLEIPCISAMSACHWASIPAT